MTGDSRHNGRLARLARAGYRRGMAVELSTESRRQVSDVMSDARLCVAVLGQPLTAYLAGADSLGQYRQWLADGDQLCQRIAPRLAAGRRVIMAFRAENEVAIAGPWLREVGPAGDVPARVIRDKGDDEAVGGVLADAAGQWLNSRSARSGVRA
jgi:hypothetical protein